ncbi:MAG: hypothetical protein AAFO94_06885 [Bacteroidota bacterium]
MRKQRVLYGGILMLLIGLSACRSGDCGCPKYEASVQIKNPDDVSGHQDFLLQTLID